MKKLLLSFFFFSSAFANQTFLIDPYYSPYMGSSNLLLGMESLIKLDDYAFPNKEEESIGKRWAELASFGALSILTTTAQHEVFGHGYRLRELGISPSGYSVTLWGGSTRFYLNDDFLVGNLLAVDVAGLEAESILANKTKMQWMGKGSIDGRSSLTYFLSQQSLFFYTLTTQLGRLKGSTPSDGNDVESYISLLNSVYPNSHIKMSDLTLWSIFNWLDPMSIYAWISWSHYIDEGTPWIFPSFQIGENVRYLPNIKIGYAPYAPESYFENFFSIDSRPLYFYLKGGKRSYGVGFAFEELLRFKKGSLGLHLDGWSQRKFVSKTTITEHNDGISPEAPKGRVLGLAASLTSRIQLYSSFNLFLEIGGKTKGYLPGYTLSSGLVIRGGITLTNY